MMLMMLIANEATARKFGRVKNSSTVEILHEAWGLALMGEIALRALGVFYTSFKSIEYA